MRRSWRFLCLYLLCVISLLVWLCSCSPRVITVPEVHTEYVYRTDSFVKRDSIHVMDSVFIREKGDTVWVERWKTLYRDIYRDVVRVDTIVRLDSIPYKVEVEKPLTWWQEKKIAFGDYALCFLFLLLVYVLIRGILTRKV